MLVISKPLVVVPFSGCFASLEMEAGRGLFPLPGCCCELGVVPMGLADKSMAVSFLMERSSGLGTVIVATVVAAVAIGTAVVTVFAEDTTTSLAPRLACKFKSRAAISRFTAFSSCAAAAAFSAAFSVAAAAFVFLSGIVSTVSCSSSITAVALSLIHI